jgi:predicted branched-subunit amino acid permease
LRSHHNGINGSASGQGIDAAIVAHFAQIVAAKASPVKEHHYRLFGIRGIVIIGQIQPKIVAVLDGIAARYDLRRRTQGQQADQKQQ